MVQFGFNQSYLAYVLLDHRHNRVPLRRKEVLVLSGAVVLELEVFVIRLGQTGRINKVDSFMILNIFDASAFGQTNKNLIFDEHICQQILSSLLFKVILWTSDSCPRPLSTHTRPGRGATTQALQTTLRCRWSLCCRCTGAIIFEKPQSRSAWFLGCEVCLLEYVGKSATRFLKVRICSEP